MSQEIIKSPVFKVGISTVLSSVALAGVAEESASYALPQEAIVREVDPIGIPELKIGGLAVKQSEIFLNSINDTNTQSVPVKLTFNSAHSAVKKRPVLPPMLRRIGGCETGRPQSPHSRINYKAQNPTSTASGGFQFLDTTWDNYRGYKKAKYAPPSVQDRRAKIEYNRNGTRPWLASKYCWD